ncbi:oocyte zinc finger -like [Pelobates cultripes]|uniref:Oocyte zinc finger -like n=1 Tax=Pelobates cultripes TaxID=61616 RepID=A0AAD1T7H6_PELCU|nr:oocyte zinc finger -like [Pelobates cultripes]
MDKDPVTEEILHLTLEIIYLLTGERYFFNTLGKDYIVVKKTSEYVSLSSNPNVFKGSPMAQNPSTVPPPPVLIHEKKHDQKILELTNQIIELLTGEVPIGCVDVTVCSFMEETKCLEENKDINKDVIKENHQPISSMDFIQDGNVSVGSDTQFVRDYIQEDVIVKELKVEEFNGISEPDIIQNYSLKNEEFPICEEVHFTDNYTPTEYHIKEESASCEAGYLKLISTPTEHPEAKYPSTHFKEEPTSCEEAEIDIYTSTKHTQTEYPSDIEEQRTETGIFHHKTQIAERRYPCSNCQRCFTSSSDLFKHQAVQKMPKPACSECGKCFSSKSNLTAHQKIHTTFKPFSCS